MPCGVEQKNQGRARVKIAVFFVLAIHVVVLGALLMQGCKQEEEKAPVVAETNPPPVVETTTPPPMPPPTAFPPVVVPTNPPETIHIEAPVVATEYAIAKGDTFSSLATKFHVKVKAIQDANPGVDPTKLQINQKIKIPAPSASVAIPSAGTVLPEVDASVYVVKSGDIGDNIAKKFHTTVKAIAVANNMTLDQMNHLKVGQKLKLPVSAPAPAPAPVEAVPSPAPAAPAAPGTPPLR